jgi:hypothetical protein
MMKLDQTYDHLTGGRRMGYDRRSFNYSWHIPERRSGVDRRCGMDRRKAFRTYAMMATEIKTGPFLAMRP